MLRLLYLTLDTAVLTGFPVLSLLGLSDLALVLCGTVLVILFNLVNIFPGAYGKVSMRVKVLAGGCDLLIAFLIAFNAEAALLIYRLVTAERFDDPSLWATVTIFAVVAVVQDSICFWNGIIRTYLTSYQLGIKMRVLAAVFGLVPVVNIGFLVAIIVITRREVVYETQYEQFEKPLAEQKICATKYPVLLVHGVFFRDSKILNYWGRVPAALERCGAVIRYGNQQSALSVADSAAELAQRIGEVVNELGCEKVNIIAHSKGGLDSRYAVSRLGADKYVASLTTINTPHRGCVFVEKLYDSFSEANRERMAKAYNFAARRVGDSEPDFLSAVADLRESACTAMNAETPDSPAVYYQSVGSAAKYGSSARFPLNISIPLVRKTDGDNDGLVSVESMRWGEDFRVLRVTGMRGITHADMIDLNRENIRDFDVRRCYIDIVSELRQKGF
ncbi:MAG: triacylglycerol lipase [Ruminiclostridium sp.]|nr:triacylglycerol lipase [Ruminiclostridium sp.]